MQRRVNGEFQTGVVANILQIILAKVCTDLIISFLIILEHFVRFKSSKLFSPIF